MDTVRAMMRLGMMQLTLGTLHWLSNSSFEAQSEGGRGEIQGQIVEWRDGMPATLRYTIAKVPNVAFFVRYGYGHARSFPPAEVTYSHLQDGDPEEVPVVSYKILQLDTGQFDANFPGFRPSTFVPDLSARVKTLKMRSNEVLYLVKSDGTLVPLAGGKPDWDSLNALKRGPRPEAKWGLYLIIIAIIGAGVLALRWRRGKWSIL